MTRAQFIQLAAIHYTPSKVTEYHSSRDMAVKVFSYAQDLAELAEKALGAHSWEETETAAELSNINAGLGIIISQFSAFEKLFAEIALKLEKLSKDKDH